MRGAKSGNFFALPVPDGADWSPRSKFRRVKYGLASTSPVVPTAGCDPQCHRSCVCLLRILLPRLTVSPPGPRRPVLAPRLPPSRSVKCPMRATAVQSALLACPNGRLARAGANARYSPLWLFTFESLGTFGVRLGNRSIQVMGIHSRSEYAPAQSAALFNPLSIHSAGKNRACRPRERGVFMGPLPRTHGAAPSLSSRSRGPRPSGPASTLHHD